MHSFRRRSVDQCGLVHGKCGSSVWDRQGPGQLRHNESRPKHPPIRARLPASAKACGRTAGIASLRQTRPARQTCRRLRGTGCLSASWLFYGDSGSPSLPPGQGAHHRVHRRRPVRDCAYARASTSDRAAACPRSEESPRPARSWRISDWHLRCRDISPTSAGAAGSAKYQANRRCGTTAGIHVARCTFGDGVLSMCYLSEALFSPNKIQC